MIIAQPTSSIGLHVMEDHTNLIYTGLKPNESMHTTFNVGYNKIEECFEHIARWIQENHAAKIPVHVTVSGAPVQYLVTAAPPVPQAVLQRSFKLQMKQLMGEEPSNLFYLSLFKQDRPDGHHEEYVVASVKKELREALVQAARRHKVKLVTWDLDILCHAKLADYLWIKNECSETSRFLIVLEWDKSQLLISHPDGQLVAQSFSLGTSSFMERLVQIRAQIAETGTSIEEEDIHFPSSDTEDISQRKREASEAIHEVYIPFSQQVKTQLYATCNEYGISLPTHFAVVGEGASLFGIKESLSRDLGLISLSPEPECPSEMVVAFGSLLNEKKRLQLNFLPRGSKESWRLFKENIAALKGRLTPPSLSITSSDSPFLSPRNISIAGVVFLLLLAIPFFQRSSAISQLEAAKVENKKLVLLKADIEKAQKKESDVQRKIAVIKLLEAKKPRLSRAMKEIITILPGPIKLKSVVLKADNLIVKGEANSHGEVQSLLKSAQSLNYLSEPLPVGMLEQNGSTHFEIAFRMKR